jgi:hypothetical protein
MISLLYPDALIIADCVRQHRARQFSIMTAIHDVEDKKDAKVYLDSIDASLSVLEKELVQDRRALAGLGQQTSNGAGMANDPANIGKTGDNHLAAIQDANCVLHKSSMGRGK